MRGSAEKNLRNEIFKLPYLVLIVSVLATLGATYIFYKNARARDLARFQGEASSLENRIEVLLGAYISMIKAGRGFVGLKEEPSRDSFADFVASLEIREKYGGMQGIGYAKKIDAAEKDAVIKKMRTQEGFEDFKIFPPEPERSEYHPIIYLEPLDERNRKAIGFDMHNEPIRRQAMMIARDTGQPAATGKVTLVQETEDDAQQGFLIYVPVYKGGKTPSTIEERRRLLDGYVYSPFRAGTFLDDVQKNLPVSDISVTIYETEQKPENILAQTHAGNLAEKVEDKAFTTVREIEVAGRRWVIESAKLPSFELQSSAGWTPLIFISGFIFSLLLFGMTYLESYARMKAESLLLELQESEREKGFLLEREQLERRRAQEANRAKDEFIAIVSHELRTPLNSIAGWSQILHAENLSPATKKQALQKIDKNLRRQTKIVEELLDFSQILSGKSDLNREEVDFSQIFENAYEAANALAREKGVSLSRENLLNGHKIRGDRERLGGVVKNLLSNAVKFTPPGGSVYAGLQEKDGMLELMVKDTGQGIAPEFLPHIFDKFKQADSSTTRQHGGLGLGLAISAQIVNLHGGDISAVSKGVGKGAVFTVKLPLEKESAAD